MCPRPNQNATPPVPNPASDRERLLSLSLGIARSGFFVLDLRTDVVHVDASFWRMIGEASDGPSGSFEQLIHRVHPDDRDLMIADVAAVKRAIDRWNQRRSDLIERIDETLLAQLPTPDPARAEQHSETAGMMIDRLAILGLKIFHLSTLQARKRAVNIDQECAEKVALLEKQREDLAECFTRLIEDATAGRRYFKMYRQFKAYNDPRLNPVLREES